MCILGGLVNVESLIALYYKTQKQDLTSSKRLNPVFFINIYVYKMLSLISLRSYLPEHQRRFGDRQC